MQLADLHAAFNNIGLEAGLAVTTLLRCMSNAVLMLQAATCMNNIGLEAGLAVTTLLQCMSNAVLTLQAATCMRI